MVEVQGSELEGSKSSVLFTLRDNAGALSSVLSIFEKHGVNMTHIESR